MAAAQTFTYFILGCFIFSSVYTFDPSIRYHGPKEGHSPRINYSYVNLKRFVNSSLDVTPLFSVNVSGENQCFKECVMTNGVCLSMNVERLEQEDMYGCEILATDKYRSESKLSKKENTTHYAIVNKCMKNPCPKNRKCYPNYRNDTFQCVLISACDPYWSHFGNHCYKFNAKIKKNWLAAKYACQKKYGAQLTSIDDEGENEHVHNITKHRGGTWIGLNDHDMEGQFLWVDGKKPQYLNFRNGEPNNGGWTKVEEDCIFMTSIGNWIDTPCDEINFFVCKKKSYE